MSVLLRGLNPVPDKEVIALYEGSHVPLENMSDFYGKVSPFFDNTTPPLATSGTINHSE